MRAEPSRNTAPAARRLITLVVLTIADDLLAEHSEQRDGQGFQLVGQGLSTVAGMIKTDHATCRVFTEVDVR